ncbi:hypothetical protein CCB80_04420 [Armatimonadetes bacterium Uphvl-Ar1]|nr:hypothetical protein CCB80_04420 [Armatimonadetes bacterium Uphvl-Ar1]
MESKVSARWLKRKTEVDERIVMLSKDSRINRLKKIKAFSESIGDETSVYHAYLCARYLVSFSKELREELLSPKLINQLSNSVGSTDPEFVKSGYIALNFYKQSPNWHRDTGTRLLNLYPKEINVSKAYVLEGLYSSQSSKRVLSSITKLNQIQHEYKEVDHVGIRATLLYKLYNLTKKVDHARQARDEWQEVKRINPDPKAKQLADIRLRELNKVIG